MAEEVVLKYTASVYQEKIQGLEAYRDRLAGHLTELQNLKERVSNYFEGDDAVTYFQELQKQIETVRDQHEKIDSLRMKYNDTMQDLGRQSEALNTSINNFREVQKDQLEVVDTAVKAVSSIVPLL